MSVCHTGKVKIHCDFWRNFLSITTFSVPLPPAVCLCACVLSRFSRVRLFVTPWTVARQAPLFMGFSRQEYWNEEPFPSPGDLTDAGIEPRSPTLQQILYSLSHQGSPELSVYLLLDCSPSSVNYLQTKGACLASRAGTHSFSTC